MGLYFCSGRYESSLILPRTGDVRFYAAHGVKQTFVSQRSAPASRFMSTRLDRDLPADLDHLLGRQPEVIGDVRGIALHRGKYHFLPTRKAFSVGARYHGLVPDIVGHVIEIDGTAARFELLEHARHVRPFHEAKADDGAPKAGRDRCDRETLLIGDP